jgi:hypothetical protein
MPHWRPIDKRFGSGQRAASLPRWIERSTARAGAYECGRDDDLRWMTLDSRDSSPGSIVRIARPLERRTIKSYNDLKLRVMPSDNEATGYQNPNEETHASNDSPDKSFQDTRKWTKDSLDEKVPDTLLRCVSGAISRHYLQTDAICIPPY